MQIKKMISKGAGLPWEPSGLEERVILLAVISILIALSLMTTFENLVSNGDLVFRNPLLPVTAFFIMRFLMTPEWEYLIFGVTKVMAAAMIFFLGMPVITNVFWYVWAVVAGLFLISGVIDLIASNYEKRYVPEGYPE